MICCIGSHCCVFAVSFCQHLKTIKIIFKKKVFCSDLYSPALKMVSKCKLFKNKNLYSKSGKTSESAKEEGRAAICRLSLLQRQMHSQQGSWSFSQHSSTFNDFFLCACISTADKQKGSKEMKDISSMFDLHSINSRLYRESWFRPTDNTGCSLTLVVNSD